MNDIIETIASDPTLTPAEVEALMAKLHAADEASGGEATSEEGTIFIAEDDASQPSGTVH